MCDREVSVSENRYGHHTATPGKKVESDLCPMTGQRVPVSGESNADYLARAYLVADLAEQLQDRDPNVVWQYLTAVPAGELQRMMVVALAGIPVEGRVTDIWGWVLDLPVAREAA